MSKIDELISKYCPNGVVYRKVSDVAKVSIGKFVHKNNQNPDGLYPVYNGGTSNTGYYDEFNNTANKIIISARGANAGFVNKVLVDYWAGNSCYTIDVVSDELDWNFVYYFLKNSEKSLIGQQQTGSIPAVSKKQIETFKIPLPPLSVQQEIVRILDGFSELEKELEKELVARRKQYEYYRNQLVSFGEWGNHACDVKYFPLGEVCEILDNQRKPISKANRESGEFPYYGANGIQDWVSGYLFDGTFLLVGEDGSVINADKSPVLNWATGKIWVNNHAHVLAEKSDVALLRYVYFALSCVDVSDIVRGVPPKLNQQNLRSIKIPIPPLAEQERIVAILDKFDALVNDISVGLPAELKARCKQYEYWRNKLLDFKEAV